MKKDRTSLDGFIPRRPGAELGVHHQSQARQQQVKRRVSPPQRRQGAIEPQAPDDTPALRQESAHATSIRQSLESIGSEDTPPQTRRERRRALKERRKASKKRRIIKRILIVLAVILLGLGAYVGYEAFIAYNKMFEGGLLGIVQRQPLKQDENGRSNFIVFGTAEDNEGGTHDGANLTDSLMVLSVDQEKKDAYMVSIPRDLWVDYGKACMSGYQGKINEVYSCGSGDGEDETAGAGALQQKIGQILGLDIQYYVHLNFTAVVDAVDAVGGVDVTIESNPEGVGILDRNFDWKCNYQCHFVKYNDGEVAHLDGEHALALARARNASGGYGLAAGNFDREKNQQKIIKALREKALSAGTLTNLGKVTGLIDALGNNLRTNIDTSEVQTMMALASELSSSAIRTLTLVDEDEPLVTTGMVGSASVVQPVAGLYDYTAIQAYIQKNSSRNEVVREGAKVVVLNGSDASGVAGQEAEKLTTRGYTVSLVGNAPDGEYAPVEVYQIGEGNGATAEALATLYKVTLKQEAPPVAVAGDVSFVVILGQAPATPQAQS